mgnify:CR=1 FL=1
MSAIVGILSQSPVKETSLQGMRRVLQHRGQLVSSCEKWVMNESPYPFVGVATNESVASNVHTPVWNTNHTKMLAYYGDIYNEDELRAQYALCTSGSQLLLDIYDRVGLQSMLNALDGAFGLCIVDTIQNAIYLIRDRLGEKPLYVYQNEQTILFATEYKAFYAHPSFKAVLNEEALSEYFVFRYPVGDATWLKGVWNVTPGHYLEISVFGVAKHCYWQLPKARPNHLSKEENREQLKQLIYKSVERRSRGTQHIGIQLSGGVDSSYLCAMAKTYLHKDVSTYSVTFEGAEVDESKYIDYVNNQFGLESHKFDCKPDDFLSNWKKSTWFFEAPMNHEGTVTLLPLNRMAKQDVKILLCGDGPDESMGGYPIFRRIDAFHRDLFGLRWLGVKAKAILQGKKHYSSLEEHYISLHQFIADEDIKRLRPNEYKRDIKLAFKKRLQIMRRHRRVGDFLHKLTNFDLCTYGLEVSMRTEKMALASALNVRSPFLMPELQEFIQTIPPTYLTDYKLPFMRGTKILLKELCAEEFGEAFTYRPKIGLGIPIADILASPVIRQYVETLLLPSIRERGIVNFEFVQNLWNDSKSKSISDSLIEVLWCVLSFEIWAQMYLDNNPITYE